MAPYSFDLLGDTMRVLEQAQRVCDFDSNHNGRTRSMYPSSSDTAWIENMEPPTHFFAAAVEPTPIRSSSLPEASRSSEEEPFSDDPFHQRMMNVALVAGTFDDSTPLPVVPEVALSQPAIVAAPTKTTKRNRKLQPGQWNDRFQDLLQFQRKYGTMYVPNSFAENPQLSQWVKRQRYQYKLKQAGKHSTLSKEREELLNRVGFIWDAHESFWLERLHDLAAFRQAHGHCNVPASFSDASLSLWVKHQRRQYNRSKKNLSSTLTEERFAALNALGFDWNPRNLKD